MYASDFVYIVWECLPICSMKVFTCKAVWSVTLCSADMENVQHFTQAGLFISRFYPKVRELRQFQNCNKTARLRCKYNIYNIYICTSC